MKTAINLFDSWERSEVCYCHWKSNEHLIPGLKGQTDLDVLIKTSDHDAAEKCLKECGYIKLYSQYGSRYKGVEDWINHDREEGNLIHIHLHYRMITGQHGIKEYELPWVNEALETRVRHESTNIFVMNPNLEIVTLYTRILLKLKFTKRVRSYLGKYSISEDDMKEIDYLEAIVDWNEVNRIIATYFPHKSEYIYDSFRSRKINGRNAVQLRGYINRSMKKYRAHNAFRTYFDRIYWRGVHISIVLLRRISKNRLITRKIIEGKKGIIIAFVGQDGAGKSTVTKDVLDWLTYKMEAHKFYLGSGEHYKSWRRSLKEILLKHKNPLFVVICACLSISECVHLAKVTLHTMEEAEKYSAKGGIVLYDRFPQVEFYGINDGPKIRENYVPRIKNSAIKNAVLKYAEKEEMFLRKAAAKKPQLVFKLTLPPEESLRRKPDEDMTRVIAKHNIIKNMNFDDSKVVTIDATMPYEEELRMIKEIIWEQVLE